MNFHQHCIDFAGAGKQPPGIVVMQIDIKENILEFLGYHGTNEKSARSILTDGVQARFLPPMGQIGRGFYLAKMNGTLPQWGGRHRHVWSAQQAFLFSAHGRVSIR